MRRYGEVRIRFITDDAHPDDIKSTIHDALIFSPVLEIGELDILVKLGDEIQLTGGGPPYALPLPALEDFEIPQPGG